MSRRRRETEALESVSRVETKVKQDVGKASGKREKVELWKYVKADSLYNPTCESFNTLMGDT